MTTNDQQRAAQRAYDNQAPDDDDHGPRERAPVTQEAGADTEREWAGIDQRETCEGMPAYQRENLRLAQILGPDWNNEGIF